MTRGSHARSPCVRRFASAGLSHSMRFTSSNSVRIDTSQRSTHTPRTIEHVGHSCWHRPGARMHGPPSAASQRSGVLRRLNPSPSYPAMASAWAPSTTASPSRSHQRSGVSGRHATQSLTRPSESRTARIVAGVPSGLWRNRPSRSVAIRQVVVRGRGGVMCSPPAASSKIPLARLTIGAGWIMSPGPRHRHVGARRLGEQQDQQAAKNLGQHGRTPRCPAAQAIRFRGWT